MKCILVLRVKNHSLQEAQALDLFLNSALFEYEIPLSIQNWFSVKFKPRRHVMCLLQAELNLDCFCGINCILHYTGG